MSAEYPHLGKPSPRNGVPIDVFIGAAQDPYIKRVMHYVISGEAEANPQDFFGVDWGHEMIQHTKDVHGLNNLDAKLAISYAAENILAERGLLTYVEA
ncbi:MAG: hypothetical protein AAB462_01265 [Patescibacteria group bacterium]